MNIYLNEKKKTISQLKKICWKLCSLFNRQKDADWRGYVACCTCGVIKHYSEGDAGHFLAGRTNGILFDDRGIHFQCKTCNGFKGGEQAIYEKFMLKRYGREVVDELYRLRDSNVSFTTEELEKKILQYTDKISLLDK